MNRLGALAASEALLVCAWSLMPNHLHLLVRTGKISLLKYEIVKEIDLTTLIQWICDDMELSRGLLIGTERNRVVSRARAVVSNALIRYLGRSGCVLTQELGVSPQAFYAAAARVSRVIRIESGDLAALVPLRGYEKLNKGSLAMDLSNLKVKILGVAGTPIKDGNCRYILQEALRAAGEAGWAETELIHLQDYNIEYCIGCDGCLRRVHKLQKKLGFDIIPVPIEGYNCTVKDDMQIIHEKMLEADGILFAAPVYILTIPGQMKTFIDRCRTFVHDYRLEGKAAGSLNVAFYRNAGEDTTRQMLNTAMLSLKMSVVSGGASTVSTRDGSGVPIRETRFGVKEDKIGMAAVHAVGRQVAKAALQMKAGRLALAEAGWEIKSKAVFQEIET